ncbi:pyridoxal-phosphate dependent enzyme [Thermogymnomonas acidicola]|uniref:pyridoxal-phosphate dependent enzyme n=1 Tax=Thermogymnomonas acidicola TaxID=399579 RepID=UPI0013969ACD|nr:pyridoxal-phosphate dependent enzyme [Thermogymnomonas acidicola]
MSEAVSEERRKIISAYGAELILTPSSLGTAGGAIEMKERLLQKYPDRYVAVDQFSDPANILAHYQRTATEIIKDFGHSLDAVVATIGTGGTTSGLALRLKQFDRRIRVIGVTPALGGVRIQGIRNPPREPRPSKLVHTDWLDEVVEITEEQKKECFRVASLAASREGILIGMSSSCALYVAMKEASRLGSGHRVLAILPDSGYKYLSTELYQDRSRRASPDEA